MDEKKPKKRGRKPGVKNKPKTEKNIETVTVKKKRGRKPKKIINEDTNKNIDYDIKKNYIIRLNSENIKKQDIDGFNNEYINESICENNGISEVCWNCCHSFHDTVYGIPLKHVNGIFYIYGYFCSLECAARYVCEKFKEDNKLWEIISLINLYNNKINGDFSPINIAPDKLVLRKFGGSLTIDEYRLNFKKMVEYNITIPPIIPIIHNSEKIEMNTNNNLNHNLKLYRKNKLTQGGNNISSSMELNIK